jgi:hypothetical protein
MKKFLLSLAMVSIVAAIHAPLIVRSAQGDVTGAGRRFVELLAKENFSGAVAQFDDTMKTVSPEPKLRETWQNIQVLNGPFQKQLEVRATKVDGYNVALVTCQFERRVLDMKVFFDAKGQVTGFFFVTTHPAGKGVHCRSRRVATAWHTDTAYRWRRPLAGGGTRPRLRAE